MAITQLNDAKRPYTAYIQTADFRDQEKGMFPFTYWISYAYAFGDITASKIEVEIPPGSIVLRVVHQISAALTGITAIEVGDGTDPNGWIQVAYGPTGATGTYLDYDADYTVISKRYDDGDTIDIAFTGIATAGSGKLFIELLSYTEVLTGT